MRTLVVRVKEDDLRLDVDLLSPYEISAIQECVYDLLDTRGTLVKLQCYMSSDGILVICTKSNDIVDIPEEWSTATIGFGWKGTRRELKLIGDYIPVEPRQLGPRPWGAVSLKFVDYADVDADENEYNQASVLRRDQDGEL